MNKNIKTVLLTLALLAAQQGTTLADTSFRWNPGVNSLLNRAGSAMAISNATVLTFVSTNSTVGAFVEAGRLTLNRIVSDDRFYRAEPNINLAGRYITRHMNEIDDSLVGMFAYAVILDRPFRYFTTFEEIPLDGSVFAGITAMHAASIMKLDTHPPMPPQSFNGGPVQTTLQVIPEPGTVTLLAMGLGVGAAVIRRRRARAHG